MVEIAGRGGICHYTFNLCQHLSGFADVTLVTGGGYELREHRRSFALVELFNRLRTSPLFVFRFLRIIRDPAVIAVHFQLSQHPGFALFLCAAVLCARKRLVVTAHNVVSHETLPGEKRVFGLIYRLCDRIVVHAGNNREEMVRLFPATCGKIRVIPHGNYMFFNPSCAECGFPPAVTPTMLFFGYIRQYKGLMYLLRALKIVTGSIHNARLCIVGTPVEPFAPYQEMIARLGLAKNVETHLAYVAFERVREFFIRSHIVVLPYLKVYQSGVLQLAYGFSRPVLVTGVGGMAEAVDEGLSGFVVPPADEDALAARLLEFFADARRQAAMGAYARELARTRFSWEHIAADTSAVYKELGDG